MIIPARRLIWLAAVPLVVILGEPRRAGSDRRRMGPHGSARSPASWSTALLAGTRPRLRLHREAPGQLHVDQPDRHCLDRRKPEPVSAGARSSPIGFPIRLAPTQPRWRSTAPPRSRTTLHYDLVPAERGMAAFGDLDYRIRGPLGLAWSQKRLPARLEIRCLPHLANAKAAELAERRALLRQAGSHRYRWRGAGTSFESLREYSSQDDIRWVDWKATARLGRPISRNFEIERHQQVMLLVDASRALTTFCGHRTKFDAMLEAAILVARAALGQGDDLGLIVFRRPDRCLSASAPRAGAIECGHRKPLCQAAAAGGTELRVWP